MIDGQLIFSHGLQIGELFTDGVILSSPLLSVGQAFADGVILSSPLLLINESVLLNGILCNNFSLLIGESLFYGFLISSFSIVSVEAPPSEGFLIANFPLVSGEVLGNGYLLSDLGLLIGVGLANGLTTASDSFINRASSFQEYFGFNAVQDLNYLVIAKQDLTLTLSTNSAESLLVALLLRILTYGENSLSSLVNLYCWKRFFTIIDNKPLTIIKLILEINLHVKYKYIETEIINANDDLSPNDL